METYFDINTDTLTNIATEAVSASSAVKDCADMLNSLLLHDDWVCKEKEVINNNITQIKTDSIQLSEAFESFSSAVKNTAQHYVDMVNDEQKDILDINQALAALYASDLSSVDPVITTGASTASFIDSACTIPGSAVDCNTIFNLNNSIQVVNYNDIAQAVDFER